MAFPTRTIRDHGSGAPSPSRTLNMSTLATGALVGDVVCTIIAMEGSTSVDTATAGWSKEGQVADASGIITFAVFTYTVTVAGTVDSLVLDFTSGSPDNYACSNRIHSSTGAVAEVNAVTATGSSIHPNPPAITNPAAQAVDMLVLAGWAGDGSSLSTVTPANYTNIINANTGTTGAQNSSLNIASRSINMASGATEDPGTFTRLNDQWVAFTIGFYELLVEIPLVTTNANSASQAGAVTLAPKTALSLNSATSGSQAGAVTLSPKTPLTVAGANSASSTSTPLLFVGGVQPAVSLSSTAGFGPELIVNGAGTDLTGWVQHDFGADGTNSIVNGHFHIQSGPSNFWESIRQAVPIVIGQAYRFRGTDFGGTAQGTIQVGTSISAGDYFAGGFTTGAKDASFIATTNTAYVYVQGGYPGGYREFGNISLTLANQPITLLPKTALTVGNANSASQASAAPIALKYALTVANDNSASQTGNAVLANAHYNILPAGANSASQASAITVTPHVLFFIKAGIDATTADTLATNPGTVIFKGDLYTLSSY